MPSKAQSRVGCSLLGCRRRSQTLRTPRQRKVFGLTGVLLIVREISHACATLRHSGRRAWRRCPVSSTVLASLAEGATIEDILKDFPTLTDDELRAVIAFAAASAQEDLPVGEALVR